MSVFVDTGAWFAYFVRRDPDHNLVREWVSANESPLVTSDYVLDELTLLKIRESHVVAIAAGKVLMQERICQIVKITSEDFAHAWDIFVHFSDKGWSFTDCTSKVIMERLNITTAFSFDEHFEQFGSITRAP